MNMNKTKILIIEDDEDILFTLRDYLELEGYHVLTAGNGFEALELLKVTETPNLILLDMKMPLMDGWEFAAAYEKKFTNRAPIIVVTAAADAEQRAKDIRAISFVEKPFNLDILLEKIQIHSN
jgi:DNA-binding response OmpR family regulator